MGSLLHLLRQCISNVNVCVHVGTLRWLKTSIRIFEGLLFLVLNTFKTESLAKFTTYMKGPTYMKLHIYIFIHFNSLLVTELQLVCVWLRPFMCSTQRPNATPSWLYYPKLEFHINSWTKYCWSLTWFLNEHSLHLSSSGGHYDSNSSSLHHFHFLSTFGKQY